MEEKSERVSSTEVSQRLRIDLKTVNQIAESSTEPDSIWGTLRIHDDYDSGVSSFLRVRVNPRLREQVDAALAQREKEDPAEGHLTFSDAVEMDLEMRLKDQQAEDRVTTTGDEPSRKRTRKG